jgi:uncharacterized protein YdeI (YjbR/CyaY-like superfamily)
MSAVPAIPDGHVHATTRAEWRAWLIAHHERDAGVWLVSWRKHTGSPALTYDESVEEALCFGWVDSRPGKVDDDRTKLWFAPRKAGSGWSRPNKERIEGMQAAGLMMPAGRRLIDAAKADGSWTMLDDVENLVVPDDLAAALDALPPARANWDAFPRSAKRGILEWIVQAKRPLTRAQRVATTAEMAQRNERANQWKPKDPA